jgi:hypothetical protein
MYQDGLFYYTYYEMFEWGALWGSPDVSMGEVVPPALTINFPGGLPEGLYPPGPEMKVNVEIIPGQESYVPGTGTLYYRFDNGAYTPVALVPQGGNLYEATIPHTSPGDEPQFYFSANGDGGTTVYSPYNAPTDVYTFDLGFMEVLMEDDFETDMGWTVENTSVDTGAWERGVPQSTDAQPGQDHSPVGTNCFVTGRLAGTSVGTYDLDGGPTRLISPSVDLSGGDGVIQFYLYFYHTDYGTQQPLQIHISNNDGAQWWFVKNVTHAPSWTLHSITVSDYVTPSAQVKIRISVQDNPNDDIVEALLDDFSVVRYNFEPTLWTDDYDLGVGSVGVSNMTFEGGAAWAGYNYLVLGGTHGHSPGYDLGGNHLPLNIDYMTYFIIDHLNTDVFSNFEGVLDGNGGCSPTFDSVGPVPAWLAGTDMTFTVLVLGGPMLPPVHFISNHITVSFY